MMRNELEKYEQPIAEVAYVEVELGFAFSSDWNDTVDPYEPVTPPGGEDLTPSDDW